MSLDPEVLQHYASGYEVERLGTGPGQLEFFRTCELLHRYLPAPPADIYDIGGGPGVYAVWLALKRYNVHLVDAIPLHAELADTAAKKHRVNLKSASAGEARSLEFADQSADAVLLLGPLYHLTESSDRSKALKEAWRVLRTGGKLFAAAISRYASLLDGIFQGMIADPEFFEIVQRDLLEGQHRNPSNNPNYFTTAYFHRPEDLREEVEQTGFHLDGIFGLEGAAWLLHNFDQRWDNPEDREKILYSARSLESAPSTIGISAHILAVATK